MTPTSKHLIRSTEDLTPGDHLCLFYKDEVEQTSFMESFLRQGIERNEKIVYISDDRSAEEIYSYLRNVGITPDPYIHSGQLAALHQGDTYMKGGIFNPEAMIALLNQSIDLAIQEGYPSLRITGEMSWALKQPNLMDSLIQYEAAVNSVFNTRPALMVCQYNQNLFPQEILLKVLATHPYVVFGSTVYENFFFRSPEDFFNGSVRENELEYRLQTLTSIRQTQVMWESSEARNKAFITAIPDIMFRENKAGTFLDFYTPETELLAVPPEQILGRNIREVGLPPEIVEEFLTLMEAAFASGKMQKFEYELLVPKGKRWFEVRMVPVGQEETVSIVRDITQVRNAEKEHSEIERKAIEAQKLESLGVLAGGIAHDFNNLLTGVLGNASLVMMDLPVKSPIRENIREIEVSALRAADLTKQMLAYSGQGRVVITHLDLSRIVEETTRLLPSLISKKAQLALHLDPALPLIEADAAQIRQVIVNLVTNAAEALQDQSGLIVIRTGSVNCNRDKLDQTILSDSVSEGKYVFLEVTDNGCGMEPEVREKAFEPFFTTKFTGRGLGLSTVLGIARGHQGTLHLTSHTSDEASSIPGMPGSGTTITVYFPVAVMVKATVREPSHHVEPKTILVVDDEPALRLLTTNMINRMGHRTLVAVHGREALRIFQEHRAEIDMILLDLTMPELDGPESLVRLRRIDPNIKVVLTSGYSEEEAYRHIDPTEIQGFLQKPYLLREFYQVIGKVLEIPPPS